VGAVPAWPKVLGFAAGVPAFVELTAYDVADAQVGRPVGVVRVADVVRAVDGLKGTPWVKVALPSAPGGAWVCNQTPRYNPVLVPLDVGVPPRPEQRPQGADAAADVATGQDSSSDDDDEDAPKSMPPGGKPASGAAAAARPTPKPLPMTWFDDGDPLTPQAWFRCEPYLPSGVVLKVRTRPQPDAQVALGLAAGCAVRAVCSCGDWLMVAYTAADPSPTARAGATVRMEGWMLVRTQTRVLLVAVQDPDHLDHLAHSPVSPARLPEPHQLPPGTVIGGAGEGIGDSSSEEEEMPAEQKRKLKRAMKELKKSQKKNK
jgi:hypothetical protein